MISQENTQVCKNEIMSKNIPFYTKDAKPKFQTSDLITKEQSPKIGTYKRKCMEQGKKQYRCFDKGM